MKILSNEERPRKQGPELWFTGTVRMDTIVEPDAPGKTQAVLVTFAPSARTAWHTHPLGQTLYVISGLGWVQKEGEAAIAIRPGDVVVIAPEENHWHGAQADESLVHLALQEGDSSGVRAVWGKTVTEEEYSAAAPRARA